MHSGLNPVICITSVASPFPDRFLQLFEAFAAVINERHSGFIKPQSGKLYTKVAAKANPTGFQFPHPG
jgi:hypothetical protein